MNSNDSTPQEPHHLNTNDALSVLTPSENATTTEADTSTPSQPANPGDSPSKPLPTGEGLRSESEETPVDDKIEPCWDPSEQVAGSSWFPPGEVLHSTGLDHHWAESLERFNSLNTWNLGEPCPSCESNHVATAEVRAGEYFGSGGSVFSDFAQARRIILGAECANCGTRLFNHPLLQLVQDN